MSRCRWTWTAGAVAELRGELKGMRIQLGECLPCLEVPTASSTFISFVRCGISPSTGLGRRDAEISGERSTINRRGGR